MENVSPWLVLVAALAVLAFVGVGYLIRHQTFVVTGVPDGKKGERLVVLHTLPKDKLKECLDKLPQVDLPNLWVPRLNQFFHVEALPHLGTGKLDLRRIRELALQFSGEP